MKQVDRGLRSSGVIFEAAVTPDVVVDASRSTGDPGELDLDRTQVRLDAEGWIEVDDAMRTSDTRILAGWGRNVQPPDSIRWNLQPEMDYLDDEQM